MKNIKPYASLFSIIYLVMVTMALNAVMIGISYFIDSYTVVTFLKVFLVIFNLYQLYYLIKCITLKYYYDNDNLYIVCFWGLKKLIIPFDKMEMYQKSGDEIKGVRLFGYGKNYFAMGTFFIENAGTSIMFCTSTKNIVYLKTVDAIYGFSPHDLEGMCNILKIHKVRHEKWVYKGSKKVSLSKDKYFMIPFIAVAVIILIMTILPFVLYLKNLIPSKMPLSFGANFNPIVYGTGKEFAFKQMMYGAYNMIILFCMYYSAYFYAKYSKKLAYKFIYVSLIIASVFFIMQIRILQVYR